VLFCLLFLSLAAVNDFSYYFQFISTLPRNAFFWGFGPKPFDVFSDSNFRGTGGTTGFFSQTAFMSKIWLHTLNTRLCHIIRTTEFF